MPTTSGPPSAGFVASEAGGFEKPSYIRRYIEKQQVDLLSNK